MEESKATGAPEQAKMEAGVGQGPQLRFDKIKKFAKRYGLELVLGVAVVGIGIACLWQGKKLNENKQVIETQSLIIELAEERINYLKALCEEKDKGMLKIASDALRKGSSEGGKALVDWRDFKNGKL